MELHLYPDIALSKQNEEAVFFNEDLRAIAEVMVEKCKEWKGYALAAPQIGINKRFFVMLEHDELKACVPYTRVTLTTEPIRSLPWFCGNPEIIESSGEFRYRESCLSMPGVVAPLVRPAMIRFQYQDIHGKKQSFLCGGLLARVIQHEMDHLAGVLFTDRLDPFTKMKTIGAINKLRRKKSLSD